MIPLTATVALSLGNFFTTSGFTAIAVNIHQELSWHLVLTLYLTGESTQKLNIALSN